MKLKKMDKISVSDAEAFGILTGRVDESGGDSGYEVLTGESTAPEKIVEESAEPFDTLVERLEAGIRIGVLREGFNVLVNG